MAATIDAIEFCRAVDGAADRFEQRNPRRVFTQAERQRLLLLPGAA